MESITPRLKSNNTKMKSGKKSVKKTDRGSRIMTLLFGRPLADSEAKSEEVSQVTGVPILGLDALSSASYGPEAALVILVSVGAAGLEYVRGISVAIILLLAALYFSYRQTIEAYPNGGGSYTVAKENLGMNAGLIAGAALLLDYVLTVAVGISAGVGALESAAPSLQQHTLALCLAVLVFVTLVNLRGMRESGIVWSIPAYLFIVSLLIVIGIGIFRDLQTGGHPRAIAAPPPLHPAVAPVTAWLLLRTFASGCTAMTGVEAVSNGVPIFAEPRVQNAKRTLTIICGLLAVMLAGIGSLALPYHLTAMSQQDPGYQSTLSQLVAAVAGRNFFYYFTMGSVLAILTLSANTSFAGFPRLCRLLADDQYLPIGFSNLGRRLVYSTGILVLALFAGILLVIFKGITDRLIPLYAIGAFAAFTFSQTGMVVHWKRQSRSGFDPSMLVNGIGAVMTAAALIIIVVAKFSEGAWISILAIGALVILFRAIHRQYQKVAHELAAPERLSVRKVAPLLVLVPMSGWNKISERAICFALGISEDITAVHVSFNKDVSDQLKTSWEKCVVEPATESGYPAPRLDIVQSPYRDLFQPLLDYVEKVKRKHPGRRIAIVIPELVEPRWWEYLLHNHPAASLKASLLFNGDERVMVISIPWYFREPPKRRTT
jgi:amino acid transporter